MSVRKLGRFSEEEGDLFPIEFHTLPFKPKRLFYVTNVPAGTTRGCHAHYNTEQLLVCIKGEIEITLYNGVDGPVAMSLKEGHSVFIGRMIWDVQKYMTGKDVLLSICSTAYDPNDYITDYDQFLQAVRGY